MGLWRGVVAAGMVLALGGFAGARVEAQQLPGGVRPEHYALTIAPDLKTATFAGSERIDVVLDAPANAITLNAAEVDFVSVKAFVGADVNTSTNAGVPRLSALARDDGGKGDGGQTAVVTLDAVKEQATFTFAQMLPAGHVTLAIDYTGILNSRLRGFYISRTKRRSYGVTQFEATDARRAFPSFDEPAMKATFDVSLMVDTGDTAISNMQMVSDVVGPLEGKHTVAFATTPKMSTYLVAWVVGDFACTEGKSDGVPIRACATPDKLELTRFALESAKWDLHYFDEYFGIKYPLAKLDMIAIPDFEAGAMENFGCITYRETEMLVDAKDGALGAKKEVAETVAHEMAHQWFGDLVTPQWWDNLWLNEGFATWMEIKAPAKEHPTWGYELDQAQELNRTMDEDAARTTRAIQSRAETPVEINELFDDISYGKAGAVIGMVENWVGEEKFRKGVHAYLTAHDYRNATAEDFWNAQTQVSGQPVDKVMRSFVEQPGVPEVVTGEAAAKRIPVRQMELQLGGASANTEPRRAWTIPVCFKGEACQLLQETSGTSTAELAVPASASLYANADDKGYYRTAYSDWQRTEIVANAETKLTVPERIGLLGDEWALMQAGSEKVGDFLDLALAVKQDSSSMVLGNALGKVAAIGALIATDDDRARLNAVVQREFGGVYTPMSGPKWFEGSGHAELRQVLFEGLGNAGDTTVLAEADTITKQIFAGQKTADPKMADAAVALASAHGDAEMYERLMQVGKNANDPDLQEAALHALTRFRAPELVARTLAYAVSGEVRSQDSWTLIAQLLERRETQDQAWEFVQHHWAEIEQNATINSGAHIVEAAGAFCTVERRDEVASFFATHAVESSQRTLAKSIDRMNDCIHLRTVQEPELRSWLDAHRGS